MLRSHKARNTRASLKRRFTQSAGDLHLAKLFSKWRPKVQQVSLSGRLSQRSQRPRPKRKQRKQQTKPSKMKRRKNLSQHPRNRHNTPKSMMHQPLWKIQIQCSRSDFLRMSTRKGQQILKAFLALSHDVGQSTRARDDQWDIG